MPSGNAKEMKCVVTFLSILGMIVLGSFIIDKDLKDILYFLILMVFMVRYILLCHK